MRRRQKTEEQMRTLLWMRCVAAGGQCEWARQHKVSPQFVCDVVHGRRAVTETIADALGYDRKIVFESHY